jgi:hypothetical protein
MFLYCQLGWWYVFCKFDKIIFMKAVIEKNDVLNEILNELETFDREDQERLLVKLRAQRMLKQKPLMFAKPAKGLKKPSLQQIDKWKHDSRKIK